MIVTILRRRWNLIFGNTGKDLGFCEAPDKRNKRIVIKPTLTGEKRLSIILHELLHAAAWDHDEQWVQEVGDDIARILWKLGYRDDRLH